jgi:two-component system response regulator
MTRPSEILLVEDSEDDAELTKIALDDGGLLNRVVWVRDGVEALEYLLPDPAPEPPRPLPQVVLLDLNMPRLDGLAVLRRIRADPRTRLLPVVILTTSREEADVIAGYDLGANSYIRKPVDFDRFTEAVQQLKLYWLVLNERPYPP